MFKAHFIYYTKMVLHYDNAFERKYEGNLEDAIDLIENDCKEYGFVSCYATDARTGEVLFDGLFDEEWPD